MTSTLSRTNKDEGERALLERRQLGAYYTPERLSQILSNWAIRSAVDTVLEPSFGGCGFLAAARDTLAAKGASVPACQIFGCDVDPVAFSYLASAFGGPTDTEGFVLRDFLDCDRVAEWPDEFSVILGNPPYIPHHRIGRDRVKELAERPKTIADVGGRSSLWAYFLAHAVKHLKAGGRMAWVLPGAFLQADYAEPIRLYLGEHFDRCVALLVRERLFVSEGTDEETVILLAEGHRSERRPNAVEVGEADTLDELESLMARWDAREWAGIKGGFAPAALSMSAAALQVHADMAASSAAVSLGSIARIQIGLVTGSNEFFVLSRGRADELGLPRSDCMPVLSKFRAAPGVELKEADLDAYSAQGGRTQLVSSRHLRAGSPVWDYLATFPEERRAVVSTFKKRAVWSETCDDKTPDAFFPVMHHTGPRLVLNSLGCQCTNTIHRVYFKGRLTWPRRQLIALSMLTTFTQISAELCGRRYGSGVLKHEPRDAERILLLLPLVADADVEEAFNQVEWLLKAGDPDGARRSADLAILSWSTINSTSKTRALLDKTLTEMRHRRRPNRQIRRTSD